MTVNWPRLPTQPIVRVSCSNISVTRKYSIRHPALDISHSPGEEQEEQDILVPEFNISRYIRKPPPKPARSGCLRCFLHIHNHRSGNHRSGIDLPTSQPTLSEPYVTVRTNKTFYWPARSLRSFLGINGDLNVPPRLTIWA